MANLFNYNSRADYLADTTRPATQSSVSYDGEEVHADGVNVIVPFMQANCEVGDMAVFDTLESRRKVLKWASYNPGTFNASRYILSSGVYTGAQDGKGLFVAVRNASTASKMWAEKCYIRVTGLDLTQAGSFTFSTYYNWGKHADNAVSWDAGATLASVVETINSLGLNASYFHAAVLADNTGIGIWVNYPTTATTSSIWSVSAASGGAEGIASEWMGKYNGSDVVWQYVATSTIISDRTPAMGIARRNGLLTSWAGAHPAKFLDYYGTNGSATYVPESSASPMNRACFEGLASSADEAELALYNKYGGDYAAYLKGALANTESARGIMGVSYDDAAHQTALLGQILTEDYDRNVIPAFPAANAAYTYGVNAGVATGFEAGNWGLPTAWQMAKIIRQVGLNASSKTDLNRAIDKFNAPGNFYGHGYYFWTCAEYSANHAFYYYGYNGRLYVNYKNNALSSRGVVALDFD